MSMSYRPDEDPTGPVCDNKIELMKASEFCSKFGYSIKTIYEWKYRPKKNKVPENLVIKFRGKLFIRTDILRNLIPIEQFSKEDCAKGN